jgi:hypothetical protein
MDFGFTNEQNKYQRAVEYRKAAIADGWTCEPTYGEHEPVEQAAKLTRDGFTMQIITRTKVGKWNYEASVNIWGPDGLGIEPPESYDWNQIVANLHRCSHCHKLVLETHRYSFAGRSCAECLPKLKAKHEKPGWCD